MQVGFIGLGTMGAAIAENIMRAGHDLVVWNRTPSAASRLKELGATVAPRPQDTLQGDALLTMVANEEAISELGLDGPLLASAKSGLVHGNLSTVSVGFVQRLATAHAERNIGYVSATVFGRADVALRGELTVVAAGVSESVARLTPLFEAFGSRTINLGTKPEMANLFKVAGNFMLAAAIETFGEALALARKAGIDPALFHDVMTQRMFSGSAFKDYGRLMVEEAYTPPGFSLRLGLKDVALARAAATHFKVPMPLASLMHDQFTEAVNSGLSEKDWVSLASLIAKKAGVATREFPAAAESSPQ